MLSALMMEAVGFLYMLVITYQAARFHSSEGSLIYIITILKTCMAILPITRKGR